MRRYIAKRAGYALISLFLLSVTIFLFVRVTGDPAVLLVEPGASKDDPFLDISASQHRGTRLLECRPDFRRAVAVGVGLEHRPNRSPLCLLP